MNHEEIFQQRYQKLNAEQKRAVDTVEGPVLVIAGPGSGKTELLSLRVANILRKTDALPSEILCLTFTDSGAVNMRNRLISMIGETAHQVNIQTFHSFGQEIINNNPEFFFRGATFIPSDPLIQSQIIEEILQDFKYNKILNSHHPAQGYTYLKEIRERINELKNAGYSPEDFFTELTELKKCFEKIQPLFQDFFIDRVSKKHFEKIPSLIQEMKNLGGSNQTVSFYAQKLQQVLSACLEDGKTQPLTKFKEIFFEKDKQKNFIFKDYRNLEKNFELAEVYQLYQEKLEQRGYFDFSDMIIRSFETIEKQPELKFNLQEKYQYILVDEFQDTNGSQMELLDSIIDLEITEGRPNILAVGDDDQSIYKFQGANIGNILNFHKKYRDPEIIVLKNNYRSSEKIVDFSQKVITQGEERLSNILPEVSKELISARNDQTPSDIIIKTLNTDVEENYFVAKKIEELIKNGEMIQSIAVIGRTHKDLIKIAKYLNFLEINVDYQYQQNVLDSPLINKLIQILTFISSLNKFETMESQELLPEILGYDFWNINALAIWKISRTAYEKRIPWLQVMLESESPQISNLAEFLLTVAKKSTEETAEEIIDYITGIKSIELSSGESYQSGFKQFYFSENELKDNPQQYIQWLNDLKTLIDSIRNFNGKNAINLQQLLNYIRLHQDHKISINSTQQMGLAQKGVRLLSAHSAKGLEFNTVFIINSSDKRWTGDQNHRNISFPSPLELSPEKDGLDDKLRLFYVAITRAKNNLFITNHNYEENGKENTLIRFISGFEENPSAGIHPQKIKILKEEFIENHQLGKLMEVIIKDSPASINLLQKDYLLPLLKDYQLSVTHFNSFLNVAEAGPKHFLEKNLLRFPQLQSKSGVYGSAVHKAIEKLHQSFKVHGRLPDLETFLDSFNESLKKERINKRDFEQLSEKGKDQLTVYYQQRTPFLKIEDQSEFDFKNQGVVVKGAPLTGKIDKMSFNKDNQEIVVYDYKTGKSFDSWERGSSYTRLKTWKYQNQLVFYKLLVENSRSFKGKYQVNHGVLEFVEPVNDEIKILDLQINKEDSLALADLIEKVYQKIITLDFPDTEKYSKDLNGIMDFIADLLAE